MDQNEKTIIQRVKTNQTNFSQSYHELKNIKEITQKDVSDLVFKVQTICQYAIWGDKHNETFFDFFCDENMLNLYYHLLEKSKKYRDVQVSIIKSITMLFQNIVKTTNLNYILSHSSINQFLLFDYNFNDDEVSAYYVNMIKAICIRINENNIQLFFNLKYSTFPILYKAASLYNHKENLIRTSVRNIILGVSKCINQLIQHQTIVQKPPLRRYLSNFPFVLFFISFSQGIQESYLKINELVLNKIHKSVRLLMDDQIDIIYFMEDLIQTNPDLSFIITNALLSFAVIPVLLKLNKINIKIMLYILILQYKYSTSNTLLDTLTLFIFGRSSRFQEYIDNSNYILTTYNEEKNMIKIWGTQEKFIGAYTKYMFKNIKNQKLKFSSAEQLIQYFSSQRSQEDDYNQNSFSSDLDQTFFENSITSNDKFQKQNLIEELYTIQELLDISIIQNNSKQIKLVAPTQLVMQARKENFIFSEQEKQKQSFVNKLFSLFQCKDDTLIFLLLLFIKTVRHSKFISHDILTRCGLITLDKDQQLYQSQECLEMREYLSQKMLLILSSKYRLATYILAAQLLLDLSKTDLEHYLSLGKEFKMIFAQQIKMVEIQAENPLLLQFLIDFFTKDFKIYNSNPIQIWPTMSYQCLFEMTKDGISQIEENHSESFNFKEPISPSDQLRKDLIQLMILKYLGQFLIGYDDKLTKEEISLIQNNNLLRPGQELNWQVDKCYQLIVDRELIECEYIGIKHIKNCVIMKDDYALIILEGLEDSKDYKVVHSFSIKYTDEKIDNENQKILHVSALQKNNTIFQFDLIFSEKTICFNVKRGQDENKQKLTEFERNAIMSYLNILKKTIE